MVLEIWYVCFDFMEKIAKQIEFALSCTYSVFTYFSIFINLKHFEIQFQVRTCHGDVISQPIANKYVTQIDESQA